MGYNASEAGATNSVAQNLADHDEYELTSADYERFAGEQRRGMLAPQHPLLSQAAHAIPPGEIASPQIQAVIAHLHEVAAGQRRVTHEARKRRTLVGLAAPQIGEPYRIILLDTKVDETRRKYGRLECFINPEIVWRSRETVEGREGCFSTGPIWGAVRRPRAIKIRGLSPNGRTLERILEDFSARIACHEIDHLDGIRFPERITSDKKRHWVHTEELQNYPEEYLHWKRLCTLQRWRDYAAGAFPAPPPRNNRI